VVGRCFDRVKQWRGITTHCCKTVRSYQATVTLTALLTRP
jgi:hypothetical protein